MFSHILHWPYTIQIHPHCCTQSRLHMNLSCESCLKSIYHLLCTEAYRQKMSLGAGVFSSSSFFFPFFSPQVYEWMLQLFAEIRHTAEVFPLLMVWYLQNMTKFLIFFPTHLHSSIQLSNTVDIAMKMKDILKRFFYFKTDRNDI